jgi:O-antigen/teichoic acid export membrane protein
MLKRNLAYSLFHTVVQFIFPLITFPYATRILGPQGIGSVNFIDSFTQYFLLFASLGIPVYGIREISKVKFNQEELNKVFSEILCIHFLSTLAFCIIYLALGLSIPGLRNHFDLILIGIAILLLNVFMFEWFFIGLEELPYLVKRMFVVRLTSIIIMFALLHYFPRSFYYYLVSAIVVLLSVISNLMIIRKFVTFRFTNLAFKKHFKPLFIILGASLAVSVYVILDTVMLGFIKGDAAVGFYATAVRIVKLPFAFIGAITAIMIPQVSRAYKMGNIEEVKVLANKSFTFICIVGFPVAIGLALSSSFVVNTFAGKQFADSVIILRILTPVILLVGFNSVLGAQLLTSIDKERQLLFSVIAGMIFSLVLNLILIPRLSYYGAAITNVATELVVTGLCLYFAHRAVTINIDKKILLQSFFGALVFIPISLFIKRLNMNYTLSELLVIFACALFYVIYFWYFIKNVYVENMKTVVIQKLSSLLHA